MPPDPTRAAGRQGPARPDPARRQRTGKRPRPPREVLIELLERIDADPEAKKAGRWAGKILTEARLDEADEAAAPPTGAEV